MSNDAHAPAGDIHDLRAALAGDAAAAARLFDAHGRAAFGVAYHLLESAEEAEDIVQDAFERLWTRGRELADEGVTPRAWLLRVARNRAIDRLRKHRETLPATLPDTPDPGPGPAHQIDAGQRAARVRAAIAKLPERQRSALLMTWQGGLAVREAATALGIGERACESLLARARRTLRATLADDDPRLETP